MPNWTTFVKKELTWQDIKRIVKIADDLLPGHDTEQLLAEFQTEESYYKEILKRFREGKDMISVPNVYKSEIEKYKEFERNCR